MRILALAELYPWPALDGYCQRLDHVLRGLSTVGTVDLLAPVRPGRRSPEPSAIDGFGEVVSTPFHSVAARQWFVPWLRSDLPRRIEAVNWQAPRSALTAWGRQPDLIWYSHLDTWAPLHDLFPDVPSIVDFDNLENIAMGLRRRRAPRFAPDASPVRRLATLGRWATSRAFDLVDERRWDQLQRRCCDEVDRVVVCSSLDVRRSGCEKAVSVPNGADVPQQVRSDRTALMGMSPVLGFVGALDYEPNTEAMAWFAREVLPLVRLRRPEVRLRVVGRGSDALSWLAGTPGVQLIGEVESVRAELDRMDVAVVPIREGAGTRLKVIEALAHRVPLVTTSMGCEGIDVVDGTHALVADDPRRFADACLRALSEPTLRQHLADAGAALFEDRYRWDGIIGDVAALATEVAGGR